MNRKCKECNGEYFINTHSKRKLVILFTYLGYILFILIILYKTLLENQRFPYVKYVGYTFLEFLNHKLFINPEGLLLDIMIKYIPILGFIYVILIFIVPNYMLGENQWYCKDCGEEIEFEE
jgi:hypothetical protein